MSRRALIAIAVSLAIHVIALWLLTRGKTAQALHELTNQPVEVDLTTTTLPGKGEEPKSRVEPRPAGKPQVQAKAQPSESAPAPAQPEPAAAPEAEATNQTGTETGTGTETEGEAPAVGAATETGTAPGATAPSAPQPAAPDLTPLHARLSATAARCYPPAARRYRLRGTLQLTFCIDAAGALTRIQPLTSTGSALLDRAATDCVLPNAVPLPAPAGCYTVPIVFDDR